MSSTFDTVDHRLLLDRLCNCFGFRGQVLKLFESYLHNRKQFLIIDGVKSYVKDLQFGVPQAWTNPVLVVHLPFALDEKTDLLPQQICSKPSANATFA